MVLEDSVSRYSARRTQAVHAIYARTTAAQEKRCRILADPREALIF
jgi:hypothetical protein